MPLPSYSVLLLVILYLTLFTLPNNNDFGLQPLNRLLGIRVGIKTDSPAFQ